MSNNNNNNQKKKDSDSPLKPDPKTLHTTDPQEKMSGPVSSLMHKTAEGFDSKESREHAEERREDHM
jgi:hypothetical protein